MAEWRSTRQSALEGDKMRTVFTWIRHHKKQIGAAATVGVILLIWILAVSVPGSEKDTEHSQGELWAGIAGTLTVPTPKPAETPQPSETPQPTETPKPTKTPKPAETLEPTETPQPRPAGMPVLDEEYDLVYEGMSLLTPHQLNEPMRTSLTADLYTRQFQDEEGEYIELSMWVDGPRKEVQSGMVFDGPSKIWQTFNHDEYGWDGELERQQDTVRISKDRALCYYVLERDGSVYLMRYSVERDPNMATMSYKVFVAADSLAYWYQEEEYHGEEYPYDEGSISVYLVADGSTDTKVSFPVGEMCAFAETVKGYMESGDLAASALHGAFEVGVSEDRDNPIMPYLYDVFPWLPELAAELGISAEGFHSAEQMLAEVQSALPADPSVVMPDVETDGKYFITGNYYMSNRIDDGTYHPQGELTICRNEDGSYGGEFEIYFDWGMEFTGRYDDGILTVTDADGGDWPVEMEISFADGKATVTVTDVDPSWHVFSIGDSFTFDRNEKSMWVYQVRDPIPPWAEW